LYDVIEPRRDVLTGTLSDAVFAASLDEVVAGTAPGVYGNPETFFAGTHPSAGLKTLLSEVFGRLSGVEPDAPPVIRLETNLGGGKTHNLIALYHAATGGLNPMAALEYLEPVRLVSDMRVGVFVGTGAGAITFPTTGGVTPQTVWGHLALQIGGPDAYRQVQTDDEARTAPGSAALGRVLGDGPVLILLDEFASYLARAGGVLVGNVSLATQTTAFLMSLIEGVAAKARAVLVLTSTQVTDAFGEQTDAVLAAVAEAGSLVARKEHVLRPSDEADLPQILSRRLFATRGNGASAAVGAAYQEELDRALDAAIDVPERMRGGFGQEVEASYPFHPDLITVLDKRLSTIPNFQRTRGALRLLARTVRSMWRDRPDAELIHLHHVDLSDHDTVEDLSSRLDKPAFEPVIRADVAGQLGGEPSHADEVDQRMGSGRPYAKWLATTAYLWSLTRDVPGVPAGTLVGDVLAPGDDPNVIDKTLKNLEQTAWYLSVDVHGYRFSTEASLPKLVEEAQRNILPGRVREAATDILTKQFKDSALTVRRTWEDAKVPDRSEDAWLVLLHWDEFGEAHGISDPTTVPAQVQSLWERKPDGGLRDFRNRLVFLAPSSATHDAMLRAVRRSLALNDLLNSPDTVRALTDEKRRELDATAKTAELEARVAVCNHVNVLYIPQTAGPEGHELDTVTTASVKPNQTAAIMDRLATLEKTLVAGDRPLDPKMVATRIGTQLQASISTMELVRIFARRTDLRLVLDRQELVNLVLAGVRNGVWEYHDPERRDGGWGTRADYAIAMRLAEDTYLHAVGSAPAIIPPEIIDLPPPVRTPSSGRFVANGKADVALTQARQMALDAGRESVQSIRLSIDETGTTTGVELARLLSMVTQTPVVRALRYEVDARVDLGSTGDQLTLRFNGPATSYAPLKSAVDQVLRAHEAVVRTSLEVHFTEAVPVSGQEIEELRRRAADTGPAKCSVEITTEGDT